MNREMYTIIGVGVALAALLLSSQSGLRAEMRDSHASLRAEIAEVRTGIRDVRVEMRDMRTDIGQLGERVARIEVRLGIPGGEAVIDEQ